MKTVPCLAVLLMLAGCAPFPKYTVTPVAAPGSVALGINIHGHTVGSVPAPGAIEHAFLNTGGGAADLGTLGGPNSRAWGINDAGVVVGQADNPAGKRRAFAYGGGMMNDLGTLGGPESGARAINNDGDITGYAALPAGERRAFLRSGGVMRDLGTLPSTIELYSFGHAINADETVAGTSSFGDFALPEPPVRGFVTRGSRLVGIGTFGGQVSEAHGINDHGAVVGTAETGLGFHNRNAYIWVRGSQIDIGNLGGGFAEAYDINNRNQVVGFASGGGLQQGFLWQGGKMVALDTLIEPALGWNIRDARAINENQQIAGTGCRAGVCQAVRLDPVP
jgi:probable HAF family extracellular repeat protein